MPHIPTLNVMTLPWHTDWSAVFGRERPLILEIGFGRGAFLLHLARTYPEHNIIGLEISNRCLLAVESAIQRQQLSHVRIVHSMAETALHHLFLPQSLAQIHVNFPDPWFRTRHSHRRLMQRDTLDAMVSRLAPAGQLYLATDILEYAEMSDALLQETAGLTNRLPTPWANELAGRVVTKYENKARQEGRACYYFAYQRNTNPAPDVPVIQESPVPHLVFQSPITLEQVARDFPLNQLPPHEGIYVHFMHVWRSQRHLMFETHIKEPTIEQHLALVLSARDDGSFTLQLSTLGHPRPTAGVHYAVQALGDWLLAQHPNAHVLIRKLQGLDSDD
jgi:tRNA (guanine-N7-)-methyltransferase